MGTWVTWLESKLQKHACFADLCRLESCTIMTRAWLEDSGSLTQKMSHESEIRVTKTQRLSGGACLLFSLGAHPARRPYVWHHCSKTQTVASMHILSLPSPICLIHSCSHLPLLTACWKASLFLSLCPPHCCAFHWLTKFGDFRRASWMPVIFSFLAPSIAVLGQWCLFFWLLCNLLLVFVSFAKSWLSFLLLFIKSCFFPLWS